MAILTWCCTALFLGAMITFSGSGWDEELGNFLYTEFNPFRVYFYTIPRFLWHVAMIIPPFAKQLFLFIHSDMRLVCGVGSAIGTILGYLTGDVMVGALVGGVTGVLDFEIIAKRWLKTVPISR